MKLRIRYPQRKSHYKRNNMLLSMSVCLFPILQNGKFPKAEINIDDENRMDDKTQRKTLSQEGKISK